MGGIHLRGYGQKNPKQEYKRESFGLFEALLGNIKRETIRVLSHVKVRQEEEVREMEEQRRAAAEAQAERAQYQHEAATQRSQTINHEQSKNHHTTNNNENVKLILLTYRNATHQNLR